MTGQLKTLLDNCRQHVRYLSAAAGRLPERVGAPDIAARDDSLVAVLDQFAYRFVRLQDTMGGRVFRRLLIEHFGEPYEDSSLRDVIDRLEKLEILPSADRWSEIRAMRNTLAHDYPETSEEKAAAIELAREMAREMAAILDRIESAISPRSSGG